MESSKIPLVLLHGALGTQAQFDALLPLLSHTFNVHTLDFEGHGQRAPSDRPFRIEYFAENVLHYLDTQGISQTHIFGYSMGGCVALYLALNQPERVSSLFTLATKLDWTPEAAAKEVGLLDADKILAKVPRFAEALQVQHGDHWREVLEKTAALLHGLGEKRLLNPGDFAVIQQRTRIAVGDRDTTVSVEESLAAYCALPNGEFQVLPNTPHPFEKVSPPLLANAIREFFTSSSLIFHS